MQVEFVRASAILCILIVGGPPQISTIDQEQEWVAKYLMDLSVLLRDGVPAAGIPKADPLPVSVHFTVNNEIFSGSVAVNGQLSGFSNYFVTNATLNPNLFVNLDLIFINTAFQGTYTLDSTLYKRVVPLSGSGPIKIEFSFVEIAANGTLVGKDEMLQLKDFDFEIKQLNAVEIVAEGLLKDYGLDVVLEPALRNSLKTVIKLFKPNVQNFVNWYVRTNGNQALRNVTLAKILEIIKNLVGDGADVNFSAQYKN